MLIPDRLVAALGSRYALERELGAGGMATVYLAEDVKHRRKVAIKVLKPELAAVLGAERFVQEITTTASLSHPHILPLFDSGEAEGFLFYVMPYIQGETIRERLNRETQLAVDEAVRITREVADALDYAHRQGVIHRDIKPENLLLHDGRAMVMDFGIALAVSAAAGGRMTETGLSLGTPHYMSPEQATADKSITARSDVYSLASVCYEMLTGQPPHLGASAQAIIMKIIAERAQPVTELRRAVPPNVAAALAKALEKLPADRFDSAKAFADALGDPAFTLGEGQGNRTGSAAASRSPVRRRMWLIEIAGALGIAFGVWMALGGNRRASGPDVSTYLDLALPDSAPLATGVSNLLGNTNRTLTLSSDGRFLVYLALERGTTRLYLRRLDSFTSAPIEGTEGAYGPFLSPDDQWVAFFVGSELRKVRVAGGPVVVLSAVPENAGAAWSRDGRILVSAREGDELGWVPETGGPIRPIPNPEGAFLGQPFLLEDGRHALATAWGRGNYGRVAVVDLETGAVTLLESDGSVAMDSTDAGRTISGSSPLLLRSGHLVYATPTGLMAVEFDARTHRVRGRPVEVQGGVATGGDGTQYAVSDNGLLVFAPGGDWDRGEFAWVTPGGATERLGFPSQRYGTFSVAPDGQRVAALVESSGGQLELWVYDLERRSEDKVRTRGFPRSPLWWPDGKRLVFTETSRDAARSTVSVRQLAESAGERDTLATDFLINAFSPDTSYAVGTRGFGSGAWMLPLGSGEDAAPIDSFPTAWGPMVSPDGRWIAYTSNEAGGYAIYVIEAGRLGARQKVSLSLAEEPLWAPRGDRLIYRSGSDWFAVSVPAAGSTQFGRPRLLFSGPYINMGGRSHDISPDGRRHLVVLGEALAPSTRLRVITNWPATLRERIAGQAARP